MKVNVVYKCKNNTIEAGVDFLTPITRNGAY